MARIDPEEIHFQEGQKRGLLPILWRRYGVSGTVSRRSGQIYRPHGKGFTRDIHAIGPDLQDGIVPNQEELPCPVWRPDPEFPGSYTCQDHPVKARDLALVAVQDLQRIRERGLRSFHLHKHVPVRLDNDEIECTVPFTGYLLHAPAPVGNLNCFIDCIDRPSPPGHGVSPVALPVGRSSSRSPTRNARSLSL